MKKIEIEHIQKSASTVKTKQAFTISLDVEDKEITYTKEINYSRELYGNEKIGVI